MKLKDKTIQRAIWTIKASFPFEKLIKLMTGSYFNIIKTVSRYLQTGDTILDFGSGACDKAAILQILGFKVTAYDDFQDDWHGLEENRSKILSFAQKFDIDVKIAKGDSLPFKTESFNMLMMNGVLEHLHNSPRELCNDLVDLIKPEGYFFISVPNAVNIRKRIHVIFGKTNLPDFDSYYWYPDPWRGHVREYTKADLVKLSKYLQLEIQELRSCHNMLTKLPAVVHPLYKAITTIFTGWKDSWLLVAKKPVGWKPKRKLPKEELHKILGQVSPFYTSS